MGLHYIVLSLVFAPLSGALVRYRASYKPRSAPPPDPASTAADGNVAEPLVAATSPIVNEPAAPAEPAPTFFGILKRVRRIEGWAGLYKGLLPTSISTIILPLFFFEPMARVYMSPAPIAHPGSSIQTILTYNILYILGVIFAYRAITTTQKLEFIGTSIKSALQELLTEHERKKPWVLWLTPGLLPALLLNILLHLYVMQPLRGLIDLIESAPGDSRLINEVFFIRVGLLSLLTCLSSVILAPLDVIVTRLAIQRNYGGSDIPQTSTTEPLGSETPVVDLEKAALVATVETTLNNDVVIRLRGDDDLYLGMYDCGKKIVKEEGWGALYRGYGLVMYASMFYLF